MKIVWQFLSIWLFVLIIAFFCFKIYDQPDFSHLSTSKKGILARTLIHQAEKLPASASIKANAMLDSALLLTPNAANVYLAFAKRSFQNDKKEKAASYLQQALQLDTPATIVFKGWLEMIYFKDYEAALRDYQTAVSVFSKNGSPLPEYHIYVGRAFRKLEQRDSAIIAFDKYLSSATAKNTDPYVHAYRGVLYYLDGDVQMATNDFQETIKLWHKCPEAHYFLSKIYAQQEYLSKSCQHIKKALLFKDFLKDDHYRDFLELVKISDLELQFDKVCNRD